MAELSTIARPYADALFAAARADQSATGALEQWLAVVDEVAAVASHPEVAQAVRDPKLTNEQVYGLLAGLLKSRMPAAVENFLRLVVDNDRIAALPEIGKQFRRLKNEAEGAADCLIESAFPLSEQQVNELLWGLSRKFGLKLKPAVKVDAGLIGGVRVTVGDQVLDTTVKSRLAQMHAALTAA
jgi:F-type H+-transporting ATPase subunit delta